MTNEPKFLMSANWGNDMPKEFVEGYQFYGASNIDINIILEGPRHEQYWEAWGNILAMCHMIFDGVKHKLYHDGDLYAIPEDFDFHANGWPI